MKPPAPPPLDTRRTAEFEAELRRRAQAWLPSWGLADGEGDFGGALLDVAARFSSEVAERLNRAGEKMQRGFLDWLAVRGEAARPARMPVVFKLAKGAQPVLASTPVRMQADAGGVSVVFETETDVRLVSGSLEVVVGVDVDADKFYLPAPGLSDLEPLTPLPTEWQLKSFAAAGATKLQLDPDTGLAPGLILQADGKQYRLIEVNKDLVTIEPKLDDELAAGTALSKVTAFAPFDGAARNRQEHIVYLGHMELLDIEAPATIEIVGAAALAEGIEWQYWGKVDPGDEEGWQDLAIAPPARQKPDALALTKPKGAVVPRDVDGKKSRWIRGKARNSATPRPMLSTDALKLRVNCASGATSCPPQKPAEDGPVSEATANTTPLVLSEPFYPLGREPRQFDAFYLGSAEVFSKRGAVAQVCFEMSDATCQAFTAVREGPSANTVLAGVGKDQALYLFRIDQPTGDVTALRGPLRPPLPANGGVAKDKAAPINLNSRCRPATWGSPDGFYVAVAAGGDIWLWHENTSTAALSGWTQHSSVRDLPGTPAQVEDIIVLKSNPDRPGAVLSSGRLWVFDGADWEQPPVPQPPKLPLQDYAALAPIYDAAGGLTDSMIAVSAVGQELYRLEPDGTESAIKPGLKVHTGTITPPSTLPTGAIRPAAIDGPLRVVAVNPNGDGLVGVQDGLPSRNISLGGSEATGSAVTVTTDPGHLQFSLGVKRGGSALVASWTPAFTSTDATVLFESPIPESTDAIGGTPVIVGFWVVVSGSRGDAFVARYDVSQRLSFNKPIGEAVIVPDTVAIAVNDFLSAMFEGAAGQERGEWTVANAPHRRGARLIYPVDPLLTEYIAEDPQLIWYPAAASGTGTTVSTTEFTPTAADPQIVGGLILRVTAGGAPEFCEVSHTNAGNVILDAATPLPVGPDPLSYWKPQPVDATVVPAIEFVPWVDWTWSAAAVEGASVYVLDANPPTPLPQRVTAYGAAGNPPSVAALGMRWTSSAPPLGVPTPFVIDAIIGTWRHRLADSSSNPALSWEYWNGGWWSLPITVDGTERFGTTGVLKFTVPLDIAETDWAGKTNFWIRARLVGGDYGHEEVKVISRPGAKTGETEQIVERSSENVKAPQVLAMSLSYSICDERFPTFVLAQDSGTTRDQSQANLTAGALVEAFVPLSVMLGRLSGGAERVETLDQDPPCCGSESGRDTAATTPASSRPPVETPRTASGRALLIGLDATLRGTPIKVLLLVDEEHPHDAFAPMTVEALVADRFVPIVASDETRALGESGILSLSFPVDPTPRQLFGQTLTWLRLAPAAGTPAAKWSPALRGAYLNAVWAGATETLTRELVGSSEGAPDLTLRLARPPVLHDTLELRVLEPLGDEEREELRKGNADRVLSDVVELPGDWVLWTAVRDPLDEPPGERVYALDEATGEIRFGNNRHGMIPPIVRDGIVAFRYQRTEAGAPDSDTVPANTIGARVPLNLVSPVESVETVIAADQAAGGAPAERAERVVRFGTARIRHRGRVVTARDLEEVALQSSPDIVQARAFPRRGYVRLVVVMKGTDPVPGAAQVRELERLLLAAAPPSLGVLGALRIGGPRVRRLRVDLELRVETLDDAGQVTERAKRQLVALLDTAAGGADQDGWPLGASPSPDDIAFALLDTPGLAGIGQVGLSEIAADGGETPWPGALAPTDLAMPAKDPVRIRFKTVRVIR